MIQAHQASFLLDEELVAERLANMDDLTGGKIRWDESTGLRQVYAQDIGSIDPFKKICGLYDAAKLARAA